MASKFIFDNKEIKTPIPLLKKCKLVKCKFYWIDEVKILQTYYEIPFKGLILLLLMLYIKMMQYKFCKIVAKWKVE